ncbi:hypothetical protein N7497_005977 [Penicillium chrysogenum]|nr:hypothetical protein N7497_005977 [Penicillium chrysogenum]
METWRAERRRDLRRRSQAPERPLGHARHAGECLYQIDPHPFASEQRRDLGCARVGRTAHGKIPFLEPMTPDVAGKIYGCNYIVDDSGDLQGFEYTTIEGWPDLAAYPSFVAEFCAAIVQRGVQRKFRLAINFGAAQRGSWMELDFPEKRATFLLPSHVRLPQSDRLVLRTTITKFPSPKNEKNGTKDLPTHGHIEHTWGSSKRIGVDDEEPVDGVTTKNGLHLTGVPLEPGTAFYTAVSAILAAV